MNTKNIFGAILLTITGFFCCCNTPGDKVNYNKNGIFVTGTEISPVVKFPVEDTPATYFVTASTVDKVSQDVSVKFEVDTSLVSSYNKANKTSFYPVPLSALKIDNMTSLIKAGSAFGSGVPVSIKSTENFVDGRSYLIPLTIKEVEGETMNVLPTSKNIFLLVSRTIHFASFDLYNKQSSAFYVFPANKTLPLPTYTLELKCYFYSFHLPATVLGNISGNLMRFFGRNGNADSQVNNFLEWHTDIGSIQSKALFNTGQWYTISMVYDGNLLSLYIDGTLDSQVQQSKPGNFSLSGLNLGEANNDNRYLNYFDGRLAEIRIWNRALSEGEINTGLCEVDPNSLGLQVYWKMNEGSGHIFKDYTGHGYDMDWSKVTETDNSGNHGTGDRSRFVFWNMDDKNKCNE